MVNFALATSRRYRDSSKGESESLVGGELASSRGADSGWVEETTWHQVVVWGKQAEVCQRYLRKGQAVFLEGELRSRKYVASDGVSRTVYEVHAEDVSFLTRTTEKRGETLGDPTRDPTVGAQSDSMADSLGDLDEDLLLKQERKTA